MEATIESTQQNPNQNENKSESINSSIKSFLTESEVRELITQIKFDELATDIALLDKIRVLASLVNDYPDLMALLIGTLEKLSTQLEKGNTDYHVNANTIMDKVCDLTGLNNKNTALLQEELSNRAKQSNRKIETSGNKEGMVDTWRNPTGLTQLAAALETSSYDTNPQSYQLILNNLMQFYNFQIVTCLCNVPTLDNQLLLSEKTLKIARESMRGYLRNTAMYAEWRWILLPDTMFAANINRLDRILETNPVPEEHRERKIKFPSGKEYYAYHVGIYIKQLCNDMSRYQRLLDKIYQETLKKFQGANKSANIQIVEEDMYSNNYVNDTSLVQELKELLEAEEPDPRYVFSKRVKEIGQDLSYSQFREMLEKLSASKAIKRDFKQLIQNNSQFKKCMDELFERGLILSLPMRPHILTYMCFHINYEKLTKDELSVFSKYQSEKALEKLKEHQKHNFKAGQDFSVVMPYMARHDGFHPTYFGSSKIGQNVTYTAKEGDLLGQAVREIGASEETSKILIDFVATMTANNYPADKLADAKMSTFQSYAKCVAGVVAEFQRNQPIIEKQVKREQKRRAAEDKKDSVEKGRLLDTFVTKFTAIYNIKINEGQFEEAAHIQLVLLNMYIALENRDGIKSSFSKLLQNAPLKLRGNNSNSNLSNPLIFAMTKLGNDFISKNTATSLLKLYKEHKVIPQLSNEEINLITRAVFVQYKASKFSSDNLFKEFVHVLTSSPELRNGLLFSVIDTENLEFMQEFFKEVKGKDISLLELRNSEGNLAVTHAARLYAAVKEEFLKPEQTEDSKKSSEKKLKKLAGVLKFLITEYKDKRLALDDPDYKKLEDILKDESASLLKGLKKSTSLPSQRSIESSPNGSVRASPDSSRRGSEAESTDRSVVNALVNHGIYQNSRKSPRNAGESASQSNSSSNFSSPGQSPSTSRNPSSTNVSLANLTANDPKPVTGGSPDKGSIYSSNITTPSDSPLLAKRPARNPSKTEIEDDEVATTPSATMS